MLDRHARAVFGVVKHFAAWADYHAGGGAAPSRRAAKLTYYASYAGAGLDDEETIRSTAPAAVAWESTSHAVFGTALETARRALRPRR
jgi:hypothetical protein